MADMKKSCSRLALATISCLLLISVASCGITIQPGADEIAFLRAGGIWVIQPDGTNARMLTSGDIMGLAWSPDHHSVLYRLLSGGAQFPPPTSTSSVPDAVGNIEVVGINGGIPLQLTHGGDGQARSDAWWNPGGNRLIYRQEFLTSPSVPDYVVSQSDQPAGIASKPLLDAAGIPVLSVDGHQVAVVDSGGDLRLGAPGAAGEVVAQHAALTLPASGRPARVLWQPGHNALLYVTVNTSSAVKLDLVGLDGKTRWSLSLAEVLDADFSPDGSRLLVRTPTQFAVFAVGSSKELFSWPESDPYALPWWSADSNRLVVMDQGGLTLVNVSQRLDKHLGGEPASASPDQSALEKQWWHPATNDPWSADGSQIVFTAGRGGVWEGRQLPTPRGSDSGLYVVSVHGDKVGAPILIASGATTVPAWTYPDPSTAFLSGA
jgi:WD40-like Beta Propeller Repeat